MMDTKNEMEKVVDYSFTNCATEHDTELNLIEIEETQLINTRSTSEKTYHLIVSFQEGENPTLEERQMIEAELVKSIGLEDHQRLSAYHDNTNNKHIHIAINQVDKEFFNNVQPFQDITKLHTRAEELEKQLNLKPDNHIPRTAEKIKSAAEIHRGVENFKEWAKAEAGDKIKELLNNPQGTNWGELHKTLGEFNLELRERGNGLVVCDSEGKLFCKASDVSRELSKSNLEKKLGKFEKGEIAPTGEKSFGTSSGDKSDYWEKYRGKEKENEVIKHRALADLKIQYTKQRAAINNNAKIERGKIKSHQGGNYDGGIYGGKRVAYAKQFELKQKALEQLKEQNAQDKDKIYNTTRAQSYKEFLISEALKGDTKALEILRKTKPKESKEGNTIFGDSPKTTVHSNLNPTITKKGEVTYKLSNGGSIVDKGETIKLTAVSRESDYLQTLILAREKFGRNINVSGDEEFKRQMTLTAIKHKLDIVFEDKTMENVRSTALLENGSGKEKEHATKHKLDQENPKVQKSITKRIEEKYNVRRRERTAKFGTYDQSRWNSYIASARANIRGFADKLDNVISGIRDIGSNRAEAIRERVVDVQHTKDRSGRERVEIDTTRSTGTTADRERNETLRGNDGKGKQNTGTVRSKIGDNTKDVFGQDKPKGLER